METAVNAFEPRQPTVTGRLGLTLLTGCRDALLKWRKRGKVRAEFDALEQSISAFQVRPDWYEEYWLRPKKALPFIAERWRRWNLLLRFVFYAAIVSVLVSFDH